jgi:hypothetical protein
MNIKIAWNRNRFIAELLMIDIGRHANLACKHFSSFNKRVICVLSSKNNIFNRLNLTHFILHRYFYISGVFLLSKIERRNLNFLAVIIYYTVDLKYE